MEGALGVSAQWFLMGVEQDSGTIRLWVGKGSWEAVQRPDWSCESRGDASP